jgi:hypothetical protein
MICSWEESYLLVGLLSSACLRLCRFVDALHDPAPAFGGLAACGVEGAAEDGALRLGRLVFQRQPGLGQAELLPAVL